MKGSILMLHNKTTVLSERIRLESDKEIGYDLSAELYEIVLSLEEGENGSMTIKLGDIHMKYSIEERNLSIDDEVIPVPYGFKQMRIIVDRTIYELELSDGLVYYLGKKQPLLLNRLIISYESGTSPLSGELHVNVINV
jgi:hypothetical protein